MPEETLDPVEPTFDGRRGESRALDAEAAEAEAAVLRLCRFRSDAADKGGRVTFGVVVGALEGVGRAGGGINRLLRTALSSAGAEIPSTGEATAPAPPGR